MMMMIPHVEWERAGFCAFCSVVVRRALRKQQQRGPFCCHVSRVLDFRARSAQATSQWNECQERIDGVPGINSWSSQRGSGKDGQELVIEEMSLSLSLSLLSSHSKGRREEKLFAKADVFFSYLIVV